MRMPRRFVVLLLSFAASAICLNAVPNRATAESHQSPTLEAVRVGFGGKYKVGFWTPVRVTLRGGDQPVSGQLELETVDGDGVRVQFTGVANESLRIPAEATVTVTRYVKFGRVSGRLKIRLRNDHGVVFEGSPSGNTVAAPALATTELIVTVGKDVGVDDSLRRRRRSADQGPSLASLVDDVSQLPDRWYGYEGVDTLILTTSQRDDITRLSEDQFAAIESWVRMGGHLLLCIGANGPEMLGPGGRFAAFSPGQFVEVIDQTHTAGLETFSGALQRLDTVAGGNPLRMTILRKVRGRIDAYEGRLPGEEPVIVQYPLSFGQITLLAIDLDQPPCAKWEGRARLLSKLLANSAEQQSTDDREQHSGRVAHIGYRDMSGQLRIALDQFADVRFVAFTWIAVLTGLYILLIGPADYFFLRKVVGRMHWTWLSFPIVVVAFCFLAMWIADLCHSKRVHVNQVAVIDIDAESSLVRGTMWAHVYSPGTTQYNVAFTGSIPGGSGRADGELLSWQGLPGEGLGGMDSRATSLLRNEPYTILVAGSPSDTSTSIAEMPIQVSSSKALTARWWGSSAKPVASRLSVDHRNGSLQGEFTNPLDVELSDCVLAFEGWAYRIDQRIAPGQTVRLGPQTTERTLDGYLVRRRLVDSKDVSAPWDQTSLDVPRILEIMMFYQAAGGRRYTDLQLRYQPFIDLSSHVRTGRAVLLGRADLHGGELQHDGRSLADEYDRQWTFCRIVYPVEQFVEPAEDGEHDP